MGKSRKEEKSQIITDLGKRLYDYNNENTGYSQSDINQFLSTGGRSQSQLYTPPNYLGGVNPSGDYIDFSSSKYDGEGIYQHQLGNLEDFREQNQGVFDSLGRATANFIGKTAVNVVGGLAGTVYGGAEALASGDITKLWDNEFTTALDKASDSIGEYFKVYNSNDYNDRNLVSRALLNPVQFTDELMDTLSFTAGAVITELISGGMASAFVAPRALKYLKGLNLMSDAGEIGARMGSGSNRLLRGLGNAGNLTRQLATGAAYEAAVEARHGGFELRDKLYDEWLEGNPGLTIEDIPQSVKDDIDDRLSSAGLFTFLTNMALVGGSNIVQFPKVFGAGYNTSKRASDIAENISRNSDGTFFNSLLPTSRAERVASNVSTALRNPVMEGLVEEGGQSVISGTANDFFARKYDLDSQDTVNEFITSFGKNLIDTYTTAEGWEEIGMGMIVGSLGAPGRGALSLFGKNTRLGKYGYNEDGTRREIWDGGIAGSFNQRRDLINEIDKYVNDLNQNTSLGEAMKANYDFLVQSDSLDKSMNEALKNNDVFNFNNLRDDKIHAYISSRLKAGLSSDLDTTIDQLERMSPEDMYIEFRGQDEFNKASERDIRNFKESSIKEFKDKVNATKEAYSIVDNAYNGDNPDLRDYFAHSIATAKYLDIREKLINQSLSDLTNGYINNLNVRGSNSISINQEIDRLNSLLKEDESLSKEEKEDISNVINSYNNISDKNKKLSVDEYQALYNMQSVDPVTLNLNINKITELLDDSRKLRERRQSFIKNYNDVFTEEGHKRALKRQRDLLKKEEEDRLAKEAEEARIKAEQDKIKEEERVKSRKAEIKAKKEAAQVKKNELASKDQFEQTEEETDDIESLLNIKEAPRTDKSNLDSMPETSVDIESQIQELETSRLNELALAEENWANNVDERGFPVEALPPILDEINNRYNNQINSLREQSEITPEEEAVITNIEQEEVYEENKLLNQDGLVRNPSQKDKNSKRQIYLQDNWFKRDVGNTIISLNIDYNKYYTFINGNLETDISDIIDDEGRVKINENFDSRLQDPNQFNKDTTVNIIIPTYQQILDKGIGGEGYSESDYNKYIDDVDMFPIAFTDNDGNIIGYLPTQANVKNNVNPEYLKTELIKNKELRQQIFDNRDSNITATITNKSSGTPIFQRYNQSIYDALGDGSRLADGVSIGIFKEGKLQTGINNPYQGDIKLPDGVSNDEYFNEGYIYAIIPTAKEGEHFAINIDVNTISESDANSIIKILELYKANPKFAGDANLVNERESLSVEVDFNNIQEVNRALESILYINNDNDNYMFRMDSDKLILGLTPDMQFTWKDFRKQATKDKIKDILSKRYYAVRLANFGNTFNSYSVSENGQLDIVRNRNYFDYLNNNNVIQSNIQSESISNKANERYFTAQSVIEIGNVKVEPKKLKQSEKTNTSIQPTKIKEGVKELFDENPELANIGTVEQYSRYLDNIFPDSKIKDILYHVGYNNIEKFIKRENGIYFTDNLDYAKNLIIEKIKVDSLYAGVEITTEEAEKRLKKYMVILNSKNILKIPKVNSQIVKNLDKENFDTIKGVEDKSQNIESYVVFEPEQIHILGSKSDIQGFKEFTNYNTSKEVLLKSDTSISQEEDSIEERNKLIENRYQESLNKLKEEDISLAVHFLLSNKGLQNEYGSDTALLTNQLNIRFKEAEELLNNHLKSIKPEGWTLGDDYDTSKLDKLVDDSLKEIRSKYDKLLNKNKQPGVPKTRLGLKIKPNRNKPNIEEDLAEISIPNLSLDKEAELLMKKCSK